MGAQDTGSNNTATYEQKYQQHKISDIFYGLLYESFNLTLLSSTKRVIFCISLTTTKTSLIISIGRSTTTQPLL